MGAPGQEIFSGDVSCQTHFFRGVGEVGAGGGAGAGGGLGGGGGGGGGKFYSAGALFGWSVLP